MTKPHTAYPSSYSAFYDFYASRMEDADGAVCAYLYEAVRARDGRAQDFRVRDVATARRVRCDMMKHAHGVYFICADDAERRLWFVYPEPCVNRATGQTEPYLVANHLSFAAYDRLLAAKQIRMYTATYFINENEDADVVHVHVDVHDPFDYGASAGAIVQKHRIRAPLIMDVLRRPFVPIGESPPSAVRTASFITEPIFAAACDRAFGGSLERVTAIGVRRPDGGGDGGWTYSVEIEWRRDHWPEDLKVPTYIVRARTAGRIAFERAFARALNDGPTRAERLRNHRYTSR